MPDIMDPTARQFYEQSFARERALRLKWYSRNVDMIRENAARKTDKVSKESVEYIDQFKMEMSLPHYDMRVKRKPLYVMEKYERYLPMRPVDPADSELLYKNANGDGRRKYFKKRFHMNPEDKFYFPECSNWVYGWELKKTIPILIKRHPRVEIVKQSFYRKSGVGKDPEHYRAPAGIKPTICNA